MLHQPHDAKDRTRGDSPTLHGDGRHRRRQRAPGGAAARAPRTSSAWRSASPAPARPAGAVEAAQAALRVGRRRSATPKRSAAAACASGSSAHYRDWYGLDIPAARVAVTVGASGAFPLAFLAAFDPGDRVALAAPFYPPYVNILTALGHACR